MPIRFLASRILHNIKTAT